MRLPSHLTILVIVALAHAAAFAQTPKEATNTSRVTAFVNVNVVPMDRAHVRKNQTVLVKNGRIADIGAAGRIRVPRGSLRIDGRDKYLMPGLTDMHTHLYDTDSGSLLQYLSAGVTTVRVMNGRPHQLEWREQVKRGELLGPTLYVASPTIYGRANSSSARAGFNEPTTVREAELLVAAYKRGGYDFIKVYSFLSPEIYAAIVKSAVAQHVGIVGHVPWSVGIKGVLSARQSSVEHLFGYLEEIETDESKKMRLTDFRNLFHAVEFYEDRLAALVNATRDVGVWNTPTMLFFEKRLPFSGAKGAWENPSLRKLGHENRAKVVRALYRAGARLLLGTDSGEGQGSVLPVAILEELALLVEAGLTPYDAIKTGTLNAADYLNGSSEFGTVKQGKRADLLLLDCDPLSEITCVNRQSGVMVRGRWLTEEELGRIIKSEPATPK